jgi:tRNA A37 threonylcarbamoyladenosine dehydratase
LIEDNYTLHRRFDRIGRLVGDEGMQKLFDTHIMIIGIGGVGSWAAESLARSGVGQLTLVDFDDICITNINRQLHAQQNLVGEKKATVMAERLKKINPQIKSVGVERFFNADSMADIFALKPDVIIDAIDNVTAKCLLLSEAIKRDVSIHSCGGAGGRMDPLRLKRADLSETFGDPLLSQVRKVLRSQYGFPAEGSFNIPTVFSTEEISQPVELKYDKGKGFKCVCPQGANNFHSCEKRNVIYGTASFVTGAFGLALASQIVEELMGGFKHVEDRAAQFPDRDSSSSRDLQINS